MRLIAIVIENFRAYTKRQYIPLHALTAFVGRNDIGKSTLLDALAIFFEHPLCKIDNSDICIRVGSSGHLRIGCIFTDVPSQITLDATSATSLSQEYLLNADGHLEIHRVYEFTDRKISKPKMLAVAHHPRTNKAHDLLLCKNSDLKTRAKERGVDLKADLRNNASLRQEIWNSYTDLDLATTEIPLDKEDAKTIWEQIEKYLPEYALFRSDRASTDDDSEVQDPLKGAINEALKEIQDDLERIKLHVQQRAEDIAQRTIQKLGDLDATLANQLTPYFNSDAKWSNIFKLSLMDDEGIPINKRGSGVRRLVLFSFFRAEAERRLENNISKSIIYAIEEPETAQHPHIQRKLMEALSLLAEQDGVQILLTTHEPALISLMSVESLRYIKKDDELGRVVSNDREVWEIVANDLGVKPDHRARVLVCVEGVTDVPFLYSVSQILRKEDASLIDIQNDNRVAVFPLGGGGSLQQFINNKYLKPLQIPEVHIFDSDKINPNTAFKFQSEYDDINSRTDGSCAFVTQKREIENYIHPDAISLAFQQHHNLSISAPHGDYDDVPKTIEGSFAGTPNMRNFKTKKFLNTHAMAHMTADLLRAKGGYDEIKLWLQKITDLANQYNRTLS
jgi:AAA15 family ATPase/GTPase